MISAYTFAMGLEQRRFPWQASIKSALSIADEFVLVYDKRFDNPDILQLADSRVQLIEHEFDFLEWDFCSKALNIARSHCSGEWCLEAWMDGVFHDSCGKVYKDAIGQSVQQDAVTVPIMDIVANLVREPYWSLRQILTRNVDYIIHKCADYMIGTIESDIWEGKYLLEGFDDWPLHDTRTARWFYDTNAMELAPGADIGDACLWHYSFFNPGRKNAQGRQTRYWQDRLFARTASFDIEAQIAALKETVVINPEESLTSYNFFLDKGLKKMEAKHPSLVEEWVSSMGLEAV